MANTLAVLGLVLLVWLWLDGARARELAIGICMAACKKRNLQFLDDTVSLARIGLRRTANGLRLRRMFSFDYSLEGVARHTGYIILVGNELERLDLGLPEEGDGAATAPRPELERSEDGKIIVFPKRR